ncbi:MAG: MarR family transcriptional regulator [Lachnospiraceae bacterium]|nr:MarR family transcriptional regulator [Lachnospiraceae bacterium]
MPYQTDISFQLHNLSHLLKRRMEHSLTCCHIDDTVSRNNGWILGYLAHHPDQNVFQKDIENAFCVRRSTVSKVIRLMETKGLIRRESVPNDARLKKLVLTPDGMELHKAIEQQIIDTENLLRQSITDEELEIFSRIMDKFRNAIE